METLVGMRVKNYFIYLDLMLLLRYCTDHYITVMKNSLKENSAYLVFMAV